MAEDSTELVFKAPPVLDTEPRGFEPGILYFSFTYFFPIFEEAAPASSRCGTCSLRDGCPIRAAMEGEEERPGNLIDVAADGSIVPDKIFPPGTRR